MNATLDESGVQGPSRGAEATLSDILLELRRLRLAMAPPRQLISKREASRLLGVSRGRTLDKLVAQGRIKLIRVGGRLRVPLSEIEKLASEGLPEELPVRATGGRGAMQRGATRVRAVLKTKGF